MPSKNARSWRSSDTAPFCSGGRGLHHEVVVHRAQQPGALGRGDHPADSPSGRAPGLRDRVHHQGAFCHALEAREIRMAMAVEDDVLVDLVGDCEEIVRPANLGNERQLFVVQHLAGRVVWRVHDERPDRRVGGGATHLIAVESPGACVAILAQGHEPRHEPEDLSLGRIELMVGLHRHDAVTRNRAANGTPPPGLRSHPAPP